MNFTQLQAYLRAYLETNDTKVIDQIPNFMTLALARISAELRGVVNEVSADLLPEPTQPQPAGFMGAALLLHDGMVSEYISPAAFTGLTNEQGAYYTLLAGQISVYPEPTSTTLLTLTYYQATGDNMSASLPHLLLHCAAAEAEMFQGNLQDAATEIQLYQNDIGSANGWDIQSGPITLGGGLRSTQGAVGSTNTPGAGYVKGPAGATSGFIPLWDGATGRLLAGGLSPATFADKSYVDSQNAAQDAVIATKADASALGTAAAADLTTSSTDTTAGRVTKVGDFGRSGGAVIQATNGNIDAYTASAGTWLFDSSLPHTGGPSDYASWTIDVLPFSVVGDALRCTQIAYRANGLETWFRAFVYGAWTPWIQVATSANSLGQGQTWQNLNASRALTTNYTNTTGRPIQVQASIGFANADSSVLAQVSGVVVGSLISAGGAGDALSLAFIVPNGATYSIGVFGGTGQTINQWGELR